MNNEKTGMLIAQIRKEKGLTQKQLADRIGVSNATISKLTQKQLADRIGVSNATISKWETAKGFPDISLIEPLAEALDISVSEIIAGERLESSPKTDDIISDLVDISINEQNRKKKIYNWIIAITVAILYLIISLITKKWEYTWLIWMAYCFFRVATEYVFKK